MMRPSLTPKGIYSICIKAILVVWMFLTVFMYLLLFGSPEFWFFVDRLGLSGVLVAWRSWLEPFFTANYLS
jgi:hypothetical protein